MSAGDFLFISGGTGVHGCLINGGYDRTAEMSGGYALYSKRGDAGMCMEHFGGQWMVKLVSFKGKDIRYAWVAGGCAAEACTSRMWRVSDGKAFHDAPSVKIVAGAEAQRQVEHHCMRALQHPCTPPCLSPSPCPSPHLLRLHACTCFPCLSFNVFHSVPNAGYGSTDKGEKYWIVQNSWGTSWGVNGTFMMRRGTNECGIEVQIAPTHVMLPFLLTPRAQLGALDRGCPLAGVPDVSD